MAEQVYATLLLSDTYLPGALVLAHSLIDNGATRKLAVLVTENTVSAEAISQLQTVYDYVIPVPTIRNVHPNLQLMNRADLHSAFTKIALWNQTQFSKIVYVDADIVAYRAPEELFDIDAPFSAAPDIGWPDIFNSGVMVLTPDETEYARLADLADRGVSFDGADQGLLNQHFGTNYNRISFTYNVTPSAHYQYIPAFNHFQHNISMAHFIGSQKPWFQGRPAYSSAGGGAADLSPHEGMIARWWSVYDRHYGNGRNQAQDDAQGKKQELVQYLVKGEYRPAGVEDHRHGQSSTQNAPPEPARNVNEGFFTGFSPGETKGEYYQDYDRHEEPHQQHHAHHHKHHEHHGHGHHEHHGHHEGHENHTHQEHQPEQHHEHNHQEHQASQGHHHDSHQDRHQEHHQEDHPGHHESQHHHQEQQPQAPLMQATWDAQWQPPPRDGRPEAEKFPDTRYEMSRDTTPFVPPVRYPSPPRDMWYQVPVDPPKPTEKPRAIFPWETNQPQPTRVFADPPPPPPLETGFGSSPPPRIGGEPMGPTSPVSESGHSVIFGDKEVIEVSLDEPPTAAPSSVKHYSESQPPETDAPPEAASPPKEEEPVFQASNFWASPSATNAWDEVPGIRKYIERVMDQTGLGGPRRYSAAAARAAQRQQWEAAAATAGRREGFFKVTDFPSVDDRPSLPVTPAPVRTQEGEEEVEPVGFPIPPIGDDEDAAAGDGQGATEIKPRLAEAEGVPPQSDWVCVHGRRWSPADCLCDLTNVLRLHKNPGAQLERLAKLHHVDTRSVLRRLSADDPAARRIEIPDRSLPPSSEGVLHLDHSHGRQEQEQRRHSHQERSVFSERTRTEERHSSWSNASATTASIRTGKGVPILAPVPVKAGLPASKAATGRIIPILDEHEDEVEELYNVNGKSSSGSGSGYATNSSYSTKLEGEGAVQLPSYSGPGAAWEPDTYFPRNVTAALPPDEERDYLET